MTLTTYFEEIKDRLLADCIACGNCIKKCRVVPYLDGAIEPRKTQKDILSFLGGAQISEAALLKQQSCMQCFGCLDVPCPVGINSMTIAELVAREIELRKEQPWDMPLYPVHEELARKGSTDEEYRRITTPVLEPDAEYLFFPGCNVYKQPDKIMNALTILDAIGNPYSFAPGLEFCCGWTSRGAQGDSGWLQTAAEKLFAFAEKLPVRQMIFWCPTCLSVLEERIKKFGSSCV